MYVFLIFVAIRKYEKFLLGQKSGRTHFFSKLSEWKWFNLVPSGQNRQQIFIRKICIPVSKARFTPKKLIRSLITGINPKTIISKVIILHTLTFLFLTNTPNVPHKQKTLTKNLHITIIEYKINNMAI